MQIELITEEKNLVEMRLDNVTVAEILRATLAEQGVEFAAWRKEHPSKPVVMRIESEKGVGKAVGAAVGALKKELDTMRAGLKKVIA